jgi:hypothetical protein
MPSLIGNKPNQVSTNGDLGTLAFQDSSNVKVGSLVADGNVGIGTSSPSEKLEVDSGDILIDQATGGSATLYLTGSSTADRRSFVRATIDVSGNGHSLLFGTNANGASGTERMRITSAGVLELTQGQIKFPATQTASADANTLDDYEEGTWTPVDNSGAGLSLSLNGRQYTKIGRAVTINLEITWPSTANTNNVQISLPFTPDTNNRAGIACFSNVAGGVNFYSAGSGINFNLYNDTGSLITNATMSTKYLIVSITYFTA